MDSRFFQEVRFPLQAIRHLGTSLKWVLTTIYFHRSKVIPPPIRLLEKCSVKHKRVQMERGARIRGLRWIEAKSTADFCHAALILFAWSETLQVKQLEQEYPTRHDGLTSWCCLHQTRHRLRKFYVTLIGCTAAYISFMSQIGTRVRLEKKMCNQRDRWVSCQRGKTESSFHSQIYHW